MLKWRKYIKKKNIFLDFLCFSLFLNFFENISKTWVKNWVATYVMMATCQSSRVTTLCVFDPAIWLFVMIMLLLLNLTVLIDSVDNLGFANIFPVTLEGELESQPWRMYLNCCYPIFDPCSLCIFKNFPKIDKNKENPKNMFLIYFRHFSIFNVV